jgi:hypothetical protein
MARNRRLAVVPLRQLISTLSESPKIAFVSGPLEPPAVYFQQHYAHLIDQSLEQGHHFVLATARGIDTLVRNYLLNHPTTPAHPSYITLFLSHSESRFRSRFASFERAGG